MSQPPKVLLLGDSIRCSYQQTVADLLGETADVVGPAENGQFALYTLHSAHRWMEELGTPDVVHWNNGIHDVGHNPGRAPVQIPIDDYARNIGFIAQLLLDTGAKVIWATTTPVHPDRAFLDSEWSWRNEEIDAYNAAALNVVEPLGLPVNDLHALVAADPDTLLCDDQLHLSEKGIARCAQAVAETVRAHLP